MHQQVPQDVNCFLFSSRPHLPHLLLLLLLLLVFVLSAPPSLGKSIVLLRSSQAQEVPNNGGGQGWRRLGQQYQGSLGPRDGGQPEVVPPDGEGKSWSVLSRLKHTGVNIAFYHLRGLSRGIAVLQGTRREPRGAASRWGHARRPGHCVRSHNNNHPQVAAQLPCAANIRS